MIKEQIKHVSISITEKCNLNCIYCFENNKTPKTMPVETAIEIVEKELLEENIYNCIWFDFMGGEPFLEFNLIKQVCEFIWNNTYEKQYMFYATTNGTLVHNEIKDWLYQNKDRFFCYLSLDGKAESHNYNRSNSFDKIDIDFFVRTWPNKKVKSIVSYATLPQLYENIVYLHELGFSTIEVKLAYGFNWNSKKISKVLIEQLDKLIEYYIENPNLKPCSLLNLKLDKISVSDALRWCNAGLRTVSYDMDGNYYPCRYYQDLIKKSIISFEEINNINFKEIQNSLSEPCSSCVLKNICRTCYANNYELYENFGKKNRELCTTTKITAYKTSSLILKRYKNGYFYKPLTLECAQRIIKAYKSDSWR